MIIRGGASRTRDESGPPKRPGMSIHASRYGCGAGRAAAVRSLGRLLAVGDDLLHFVHLRKDIVIEEMEDCIGHCATKKLSNHSSHFRSVFQPIEHIYTSLIQGLRPVECFVCSKLKV